MNHNLLFIATGLLFAVVANRRPSFAVAGLVLLDPFALYEYVGPTAVTLPKAALLGFTVGLALRAPSLAILRDRRVWPTLLAAIALVLATALSVLQADYRVPALRETLKAAEYLLVFFLCSVSIANDRSDWAFRASCFIAAAVVSLLALSQEFTKPPSALWTVVGHHALPRIAGPLEGPNQLAGYLALLLPVMAAYLIRDRGWLLGWAAFAVAAAAEALTFSRAGVASAVVAVAIVALLRRNAARTLPIVIGVPLVAGIVAVFLAGGDFARFWSTESQLQPEGLGTRKQLWTAAFRLWNTHRWLGIGAGNYEFELARAGYPELRTHPNGQYIQALVEGGAPLLAALVWTTIQPIVSLWRSASRQPLVVGAIAALIGLALHQVVDSMTFFPKVGMMAWILTGAGLAFAADD